MIRIGRMALLAIVFAYECGGHHSTPRPSRAHRYAGCYALSWTPFPHVPVDAMYPDSIRLDTSFQYRDTTIGIGWERPKRRAGAMHPRYFPPESGRVHWSQDLPIGGWRPIPNDSLSLMIGNNFGWLTLRLTPTIGGLEGAGIYMDDGSDSMTTHVVARRIPCVGDTSRARPSA